MTKLFKNSKQILAFVFAFAVLAVSLFTGSININADACDVSKVDYWDGTMASNFAGGTGTEQDPYIIATAEQLARCCMGQNKTDSKGKFYKVADSVKIFVMQPESIVDLDTLLGLDSAEATKNYIEGLAGKKNWLDVMNLGYGSFNGNFDGNGATVYGLYADSVVKNDANRDCGLFPRYDGGYVDGSGNVVANVCKNIAVKNSYYASVRRMGAISGASYGKGYGADVNGIIYYDTIAVTNCYMEGKGNINYYNEQGIVVDGGADDVSVLNNILVRGNYAYNTEQNKPIGVIAAARTAGNVDTTGTTVKPKLSNSVILGADPFRRQYYGTHFVMSEKDPVTGATVRTFYENVITDEPAGKVTITNPAGWGTATTVVEYTESNVKQVTATGFDFVAQADKLDWENTWFMSENGPELRAFHGTIKENFTATTHVWECEDCGLKSYGGIADHTWVTEDDETYICSVCDYKCLHNSLTTYDSNGDCIVDPGTYTECDYCDYVTVIKTGDAPGHNLKYVVADPGDCETHGHAEYWYCDVCDNKFTSDDKKAAFESAVSDADLDTGLGKHPVKEDGNGVVVMYDENGHWYTCSVDGGRIDIDSNVLEDGQVVAHEFSNAVCIDCGYECKEHDYEPTGKKTVVGDCFTDEVIEIKCNICKYKSTAVSVPAAHNIIKVDLVPANDRMEGTKAHYICDKCNSLYSDAEGKNSVTRTSLIIPKVLPAEYQNTVVGPVNPDTSNKSPSTGDNLVSVVAVAALAGAALVFARKSK